MHDVDEIFNGFMEAIGGEYVQLLNSVTGQEGGQVRDYDGEFTKDSLKRIRKEFDSVYNWVKWIIDKIKPEEMSGFDIGMNMFLEGTGAGSGFWDSCLSDELRKDFKASFKVCQIQIYIYPSQKKSYLVADIC